MTPTELYKFAGIKPIRFRKHKSVESIIAAYWRPAARDAGMTMREVRESKHVGITKRGKKVSYTWDDVAEGITYTGMWAFADIPKRTIHYWHDGKRTRAELAMLIGHEVGHILRGVKRNTRQDEAICDGYGIAAALAGMVGMTPPPGGEG